MQMPAIRRWCLAGSLSLLLTSSVAAQAPKGAAPVRIDFRAIGDDGQSVTDLKADDVTLKVNGKVRQIKSLSVFQNVPAGIAAGGSALPPPYASNTAGVNGRVIHILVDDDSISPGREGPVKDAVRMLISELPAGDHVGLLTTQLQINLPPGGDITKVQLAASALTGKAVSTESDDDAACRTKRVLAAADSMLALAGGTPTTIVIFSAGLTPPSAAVARLGGRRSAGQTGLCLVKPEDFENIGLVASTANADMYLFHVIDGMTTHSTTQDSGVESLAGVTGAEFVRLTGSPQAAISRLLRETAAYYVATFDPEPSERNGQAVRLELRTGRDKVKIRARPNVAIAKNDVVKAAASPKDMLRTRAEYHDLPMRSVGYTSPAAGGNEVKVIAMFEGLDPSVALTSASVGLFDEKNTLKKQWTAQGSDLVKRPVMAALAAPEGTYRMRVAAVDASGRTGTTDYELKAEVPRADPLRLSALVLGTQQGSGFAPRLEFSNEPVAIGYLEIYGVPKGGTVTVDLDITQTADGAPLATAPTNVNQGSAEDMRVAFGGFSIADMKPGDYLMRAVVSLDGKPVGKVVRTLRKAQQ